MLAIIDRGHDIRGLYVDEEKLSIGAGGLWDELRGGPFTFVRDVPHASHAASADPLADQPVAREPEDLALHRGRCRRRAVSIPNQFNMLPRTSASVAAPPERWRDGDVQDEAAGATRTIVAPRGWGVGSGVARVQEAHELAEVAQLDSQRHGRSHPHDGRRVGRSAVDNGPLGERVAPRTAGAAWLRHWAAALGSAP